MKTLSCVQLFATLWTIVYQAPPSMGFSRHTETPTQPEHPSPSLDNIHIWFLCEEPHPHPHFPARCFEKFMERSWGVQNPEILACSDLSCLLSVFVYLERLKCCLAG